MSTRSAIPALLALALAPLAGCEQVEQALPFETAGEQTTRTAQAAGTVISTPAGASFQFPAGALAAGSTVTLSTAPAPPSVTGGTAVGGLAFVLGGSGVSLGAPLQAEFRVPRADPRSWLTVAVLSTPAGTRELADAGVDLATGLLRARIPSFGTVIPVFPAPEAVVDVGRMGTATVGEQGALSAASTTAPTRAIRGACGDAAARCSGLAVRVSEELFDHADRAAILFPRVHGEIEISDARASGALVLEAPLRLRLRSGASAVTLPVRITAAPSPVTVVRESAGRVALSNVFVTVESGGYRAHEYVDLVVGYEGERAWYTIERVIESSLGGRGSRSALSVTVPLVRVP